VIEDRLNGVEPNTPGIPMAATASKYDQDFYAWTQEQARLLRNGRFDALDLTHLIEELEDLGKREKRSLASHLAVLLGHLLKWQYQADYPHKKSWRATINTQRRAVAKLLQENPTLCAQLPGFIADAYADGVDLAVAEPPLDYDSFPQSCPWSEQQILDDFWPASDK
jgi:hypothetical protein